MRAGYYEWKISYMWSKNCYNVTAAFNLPKRFKGLHYHDYQKYIMQKWNVFIYICKFSSLSLSLKYVDWLIDSCLLASYS